MHHQELLNHDEVVLLQNDSVTLNPLGVATLNPLAPVFVFNGTSSFKNCSTTLNELRVGNCFMKTTTVSTGLSDFHKMIVTVMRSTFPKAEPITIKYRDFSRYNKILFRNDLKRNLENQPNDYDTFERIFLGSLDTHAPQKTKLLRANHKPYVSKRMRKPIMTRSRLQNKWFKYGGLEYELAFKQQRNYCNRLYKKEGTIMKI